MTIKPEIHREQNLSARWTYLCSRSCKCLAAQWAQCELLELSSLAA